MARAGGTRNPHNHGVVTGASLRAHNRDRTGDLILTKDVLYRLSYVSDLRTAHTTPKDYADREELSVDESEVIGNPFRRALAWSRAPVGTTCSGSRERHHDEGHRADVVPMSCRYRADGGTRSGRRVARSHGTRPTRQTAGPMRMDPAVGVVHDDDLRRAGDGTRTRDIKLGRLALYQLSYSRVLRCYPPNAPAVLQW